MMSISHAPDAGRLVVQCASCSRWAWWRGEDAAWSAGWRSNYRPARRAGVDLVRVWSCLSCAAAPAPSTSSAPSYTLPAKLLEAALGRRRDVGALLEQLLQVDRARAEASAQAVLEAVRDEKKLSAWWSRWAERVLSQPRARRRAR